MKKVSLKKICEMLGLECLVDAQVLGYQIDSRRVGEGELFFALKGERSDGHGHLREVKERGGVAAVVEKGYQGEDFGLELIRVENVVESLQGLARQFAEASKAVVVGVTGSMGKTTTKEFIATLLSGKMKVGKTEGSYNTKLTFPLTILNMEGDEDVWVLEMGMSEPGDISRLLEIAAPDIGGVTNIAMAHVANFPGGVEEIAKGKGEIFSHPRTKRAIFYHGFTDFGVEIGAEKVTFSLTERNADYFLAFGEGKFVVDQRGVRVFQFELPFKQSHIVHNFLAAVSVAREMKLSWDEIERQVEKLQLPKMRFEQFEKEGILFINDAYNANPESMRAALSNLPEAKEGGKRIAVLGLMVELGPYSESSHREVGKIALVHVDHLLAFGEEAKGYCEVFEEGKKPAEYFDDHKKLAQRLKELMCPGDVVLVKGSRRVELERIFSLLN